MYQLLGFPTQHTLKAVYVLEELGINYDYKFIDLAKGANRENDFIKLTPIGKVPVLRHNDHNIFESGAISRYLANIEKSDLYPSEPIERSKVDSWLDFSSSHLGRWLNCLFFENIIKPQMNMGVADAKDCAEASKFLDTQFAIVDKHLKDNTYFAGENISIADLTIFAYVEQIEPLKISINQFPSLNIWYQHMSKRESIVRGRAKVA